MSELFFKNVQLGAFGLPESAWTIHSTGETDESNQEQKAWNSAYYQGVLVKRADAVSSITRRYETLDGREIDEEDLPINIMTGDLLWQSSISLDHEHGAAYWEIQLDRARRPLSVRWFSPVTITPQMDAARGLWGFERNVGGGVPPVTFLIDPDTGLAVNEEFGSLGWCFSLGLQEVGPGLTISNSASLPALVLQQGDAVMKALFDRGAINQHWITAENDPPKQEKERLRARIRRVLFGGTSTSSNVEVFSRGLSVEKIGTDPKDLEMEATVEGNQKDIATRAQTPDILLDPRGGDRAMLDRVTGNWWTFTIIPHAERIARHMNQHIFNPAGIKLILQPETADVDKREEREVANAWATYVQNGVDPETAAIMLGMDIPPDRPFMIGLPKPSQRPKVDNQDEETDGADAGLNDVLNMRSAEMRRLKAFVKNGKHKKRPFQSDILTKAEIAEVIADQDAPFLKAGPLQVGNEEIDADLRDYHDELDALTRRALDRDISQDEFEKQLEELVLAAILAAFLLGGGDESVAGATAVLEEQRTIARESVQKLSQDIYDGEFDQRAATETIAGQTAESGLAKLAARLTLWTAAVAGVFSLGQSHSPPEVVDGAPKQPRFIWVLGNTLEHCDDCLRLAKQVHTAEEWRRAGIQPQSPDLECGGWNCDCRLDPTDAPSDGMVF
ncbi:MAG: phage portal protein [Anaerolineae bacterium]